MRRMGATGDAPTDSQRAPPAQLADRSHHPGHLLQCRWCRDSGRTRLASQCSASRTRGHCRDPSAPGARFTAGRGARPGTAAAGTAAAAVSAQRPGRAGARMRALSASRNEQPDGGQRQGTCEDAAQRPCRDHPGAAHAEGRRDHAREDHHGHTPRLRDRQGRQRKRRRHGSPRALQGPCGRQ